jgi:hypothetical protein
MKRLTLDEIKQAFSIMGEFLRDEKTVGEIAVYRGSAILLQFRWRASTQDVDAVVVSDGNHGLVRQAADQAGKYSVWSDRGSGRRSRTIRARAHTRPAWLSPAFIRKRVGQD